MLGIISYKDLRCWDNWWPGTSTSAHNWYIILLGNMYTIIQQRILVNGWKKWMTLQTEAAASTRENPRLMLRFHTAPGGKVKPYGGTSSLHDTPPYL
jgi:hypothetical protein